jgi:hypothetical protein
VTLPQRHCAGYFGRHGGQGPRDKLVSDFDPSHRSANSAETGNSSLVIDHPELANSERNDLGSISGYHGSANSAEAENYSLVINEL